MTRTDAIPLGTYKISSCDSVPSSVLSSPDVGELDGSSGGSGINQQEQRGRHGQKMEEKWEGKKLSLSEKVRMWILSQAQEKQLGRSDLH